jgi:hypothetical protein
MNFSTATGKFFCDCGAETHAVMEGYQRGAQIVSCWDCGHVVGLAPAARVWSASTAQGARRRRLHELHHMAVSGVPPRRKSA